MTMNNFEKLLGKNGELVEFRKKQVLEGVFGIIQRNYEDKPNMEVVAALFGKKLGEEFTVKCEGKCYKAYFKTNGIRVRAMYRPFWDIILTELFTGEAVIVDG